MGGTDVVSTLSPFPSICGMVSLVEVSTKEDTKAKAEGMDLLLARYSSCLFSLLLRCEGDTFFLLAGRTAMVSPLVSRENEKDTSLRVKEKDRLLLVSVWQNPKHCCARVTW